MCRCVCASLTSSQHHNLPPHTARNGAEERERRGSESGRRGSVHRHISRSPKLRRREEQEQDITIVIHGCRNEEAAIKQDRRMSSDIRNKQRVSPSPSPPSSPTLSSARRSDLPPNRLMKSDGAVLRPQERRERRVDDRYQRSREKSRKRETRRRKEG